MSISQGLSREQAAKLLGTSNEFLMNCARRRTGPAFYKLSRKRV